VSILGLLVILSTVFPIPTLLDNIQDLESVPNFASTFVRTILTARLWQDEDSHLLGSECKPARLLVDVAAPTMPMKIVRHRQRPRSPLSPLPGLIPAPVPSSQDPPRPDDELQPEHHEDDARHRQWEFGTVVARRIRDRTCWAGEPR